jgi:hypothetical protein
MELSRQETEILEQLSRGDASAPRVNTVDALAAHWAEVKMPGHEFPEALESLQAKGFVEVAENGDLMITEKGNAAVSSL